MVRIPGFHFWGLSSVPGLGAEISQVCTVWPKKKEKKNQAQKRLRCLQSLMMYKTAVMAMLASND